ncbi:RDD family protein [Actinomadura rupiterrae]|uniref:RDD family protein n=1 Tax=Actinomadura rupiterrae TaxID=559627 RepID=UPI0020A3A289|nr:RDD family protein [Actinomadura rupiterrae]MCP2338539.1 putative RDD family membrane protein YckC [Actinomadura rupiterrae]
MASGKQREATGTRWTQTWLGGAASAGVDLGTPGARLGLPKEGPGAVATYGRRIVALLVDLLVAALVGALFAKALHWSPATRSIANTGVFAAMVWLLTATLGVTIGKRLCGLRVVRLDGRPVGFLWGLVRTFLLVLVVPALIWDRDYRGLHDRAANTVVVRAK